MHFALSFKSKKFDVRSERKNPINPIYGESLLHWLKNELPAKLEITEPESEDWGWYSFLNWSGRQYMLGASVYFEEGDNPEEELEWLFQIEKQRSFKEKLFGREKMTESDECFQYLKQKIESEPDINGVESV